MTRTVTRLLLVTTLFFLIAALSCATAAKKQYPKLAGPLMAVDEDQDLDQLKLEEGTPGQPGGGCPS